MSAGLDTRVGATTYDLEDLVTEAWAGRIRVPRFQRAFRWTGRDVIRLFDSIIKGYPIGSLLLWVRPAEAQRIRLGALEIDAPQTEQALWVVDGQQRITSLANALHEKGGADPPFALSYDLYKEEFVSRRTQSQPWLIPLPVLFDLDRVIQWFAEHPEIADQLQKASRVTKALRQFTVPLYQVKPDDVGVLRDIFDRMNNYGKRLSKAEVFSALYADTKVAPDERLTFALIAERIDAELSFGRIDDDTVLRAILARRGPRVEREIRIEFDDRRRGHAVDFPGEDRSTAFEQGEQALRRAVKFLQEPAGVPHVTFLPYQYLLIVLSRLFAHHPEPDSRNLQLLRRWFWRAALVGPGFFRGGTSGATNALCSKIRPHDLTSSVQDLLTAVSADVPPAPSLDRFRTNWAETKIILCAWWSSEPRSPRTGEPYERAQLAEALAERATAADAIRHIFDRTAVPESGRTRAANRVLMPDEDEAVDEVDSLLSQQPVSGMEEQDWQAMMRSHGITTETARLLSSDTLVEFLDARQQTLRTDLQVFLHQMCEWSFEDTPSLADLVIEDLEDDDGAA